MITPIVLLIMGLAILLFGGDIFVRGSASVARNFRIPPLVIGLTIVAFGTSAPELVVNIFSAVQGASDIALGNVLGSNISNIFLVLGIAAIIYPLTVKEGTTWKEIPFGFLAVVVLFFLANDTLFGGEGPAMLSRTDGLVLVSFFMIFIVYIFGLIKVQGESEGVKKYPLPISLLFILGGIALLVLGGKIIVDNGVLLARLAGWSELLIGVTFTAIGTSLPELVTSAIAAFRKHVDIAVGNVVGSNVFNILWVMGITPIIAPIEVSSAANVDITIAMLAAILLFAAMFSNGRFKKHTLSRLQGVFFVLFYIVYITFVAFRG